MADTSKTFHTIFSEMLIERMAILKQEKLTTSVCIEAYNIIFGVVEDIVKSAKLDLSNEAVNWVSQAYYDIISFNGREDMGLDPRIFTQRAQLHNISNVEIVKLCAVLEGSPFLAELHVELKKRN